MTAPRPIPIELTIRLDRAVDQALTGWALTSTKCSCVADDDQRLDALADTFAARNHQLRQDLREIVGLPQDGTDDQIVNAVSTLVGVRDHLADFIRKGEAL